MSDLDTLLLRTSRSFALTVPLLPEPLRREIMLAYLLLRIADTFEDEAPWPAAQRIAALGHFRALVLRRSALHEAALAAPEPPPMPAGTISHAGYAELIRELPRVLEAFGELEARSRECISLHICRTIDGMRRFLQQERAPATLDELREYCYVVAGIVGELCTELFVARTPALAPHMRRMRRLAAEFGEGLQLVNVLKDEAQDARGGRQYLPRGAGRAAIFALAGRSLRRSIDYVALLEHSGAPSGVVAFNALNLLLALGTLPRIREGGAGAKLSHAQVAECLVRVRETTAAAQSVVPLLRHAARGLDEDAVAMRGSVRPEPVAAAVQDGA